MEEKRKRPKVSKLSLTEDEHEELKRRAEESGLTIQAYLYKMAFQGYIIKIDFEELAKLRNEINKIGININQIARKTNTIKEIEIEDILYIKGKMEELNKSIDGMIKEMLGTGKVEV